MSVVLHCNIQKNNCSGQFACTFADELGCSADVIKFLDNACSGKTQCDYYIPNEDVVATKPCPRWIASYLEVNYECIKCRSVKYRSLNTKGIT